ncbi:MULTISPECIES: chromate resistance protein ChrB domain-containing protein [Aeromonas]|uniref:chromate resistance protein ChrB domain-containing protein n=1 Tax=Aeromonas TaxID=642 RepID=UPI00092723B8|nr:MULTISPECIES: chromate resistance protein ChrB domain-containing protein [Aeromonas]MDX7851228.1 chromate resistance protein [Aeromonas caviae]OJW67514.1 MAG: chromate resistance protein [Aeromonas sp. 62-46]
MNKWLVLIIGLPTANATARMRAWRALKASGAAVLRDGAYLLPANPDCQTALQEVERDILALNGTACLLPIHDPNGQRFIPLFNRGEEYAKLRSEIAECHAQLTTENALATTRQIRKLRKSFAQLSGIDFFPEIARQQTEADLQRLETAVNRALSADEPSSYNQPITLCKHSDYQGRIWATRRRPWVDRLASAWLILRFIDPSARILWLNSPDDCPDDAIGFDFDGAQFCHIGNLVTFETLQASFAINKPGLERLAAQVHYLDVGGTQPIEAAGIERVLAGLRENIPNDDHLLAAASVIFDGLLAAFIEENPHE